MGKYSVEGIRITAPKPGACPICGTKHRKLEPHDRDSLYYQNKFRKKNKRLPTWEDAMSHCSEMTKSAFCEKLKERGIATEDSKDAKTAE